MEPESKRLENKDRAAFARSAESYGSGQVGLTKRELFAAMAMQGYLAGRNIGGPAPELSAYVALKVAPVCVEIADALLAELAKESQR